MPPCPLYSQSKPRGAKGGLQLEQSLAMFASPHKVPAPSATNDKGAYEHNCDVNDEDSRGEVFGKESSSSSRSLSAEDAHLSHERGKSCWLCSSHASVTRVHACVLTCSRLSMHCLCCHGRGLNGRRAGVVAAWTTCDVWHHDSPRTSCCHVVVPDEVLREACDAEEERRAHRRESRHRQGGEGQELSLHSKRSRDCAGSSSSSKDKDERDACTWFPVSLSPIANAHSHSHSLPREGLALAVLLRDTSAGAAKILSPPPHPCAQVTQWQPSDPAYNSVHSTAVVSAAPRELASHGHASLSPDLSGAEGDTCSRALTCASNKACDRLAADLRCDSLALGAADSSVDDSAMHRQLVLYQHNRQTGWVMSPGGTIAWMGPGEPPRGLPLRQVSCVFVCALTRLSWPVCSCNMLARFSHLPAALTRADLNFVNPNKNACTPTVANR